VLYGPQTRIALAWRRALETARLGVLEARMQITRWFLWLVTVAALAAPASGCEDDPFDTDHLKDAGQAGSRAGAGGSTAGSGGSTAGAGGSTAGAGGSEAGSGGDDGGDGGSE
jgi:hypothetical protein